MRIKIKRYKPPILWFFIKRKFPKVQWSEVLIAFGQTVYTGHRPSANGLHHEGVHLQRQNYSFLGAVKWWYKYLKYPKFRLEEELLAYRSEYWYIKKRIKEKEKVNTFLIRKAEDLSGPIYGSLISYSEALKEIQRKIYEER